MKRLLAILAFFVLTATCHAQVVLNPLRWMVPNNMQLTGVTPGNCIKNANVTTPSSGTLQLAATWNAVQFACPVSGSMVNVAAGAILSRSFNTPTTISYRVDASIKFPGYGTTSTIWMLGAGCKATAYSSNNCPAYDISQGTAESDQPQVEPGAQGNTTTINYEYNPSSGFISNTPTVTDYTQNVHQYSVVMVPGTSLTYFVDGTQTAQIASGVVANSFFLIVSQGTNNSIGGIPSATNLPGFTTVQYVRVCTRTTQACDPTHANASGMIFDEEFSTPTPPTFAGFRP